MKWKISISVLWFVFAVLFFNLAWLHRAKSKQTIPDFEIDIRSTGAEVQLIGVDFREFVNKFNAYVANQNESNHTANLYACWGYSIAGLTALVSMGLEWREYIIALLAKLVLLVKSQRTSKNDK